jgi:hypothetical protein
MGGESRVRGGDDPSEPSVEAVPEGEAGRDPARVQQWLVEARQAVMAGRSTALELDGRAIPAWTASVQTSPVPPDLSAWENR